MEAAVAIESHVKHSSIIAHVLKGNLGSNIHSLMTETVKEVNKNGIIVNAEN